MDEFTKWDDDGTGTLYTSWDDAIGGPNETTWDLLPAIIGRGFRVVWMAVARGVNWT